MHLAGYWFGAEEFTWQIVRLEVVIVLCRLVVWIVRLAACDCVDGNCAWQVGRLGLAFTCRVVTLGLITLRGSFLIWC